MSEMRKFASRRYKILSQLRNENRSFKKQGLIGIICGCVALVLVVTVIMVININARKSPIEGVSKRYMRRACSIWRI